VQEIKNSDIRHELASEGQSSEYIARVARESLNMAKPGERIFICPGGD
jgi:cell division protein FtsB